MRENYQQYLYSFLKVAFLSSIIATAFLIAQASIFVSYPYITTAITIDLLFTLPIFYYLFIRKTAVPNWTVVPLLIGSVIFASFILPTGDRYLLDSVIAYGIPVIEITVLLYVLVRGRRSYRSLSQSTSDTFEKVRMVLEMHLVPSLLARLAAFEIGAVYFAFLAWKKKDGEKYFAYHKQNAVLPLGIVFVFLIVAETTVVHFLTAKWNETVAWILTALSIYLVIQLTAHLKAVYLRPVELSSEVVHLRCGITGDTEIPYEKIIAIEKIHAMAPASGSVVLSPMGNLTQPNVRISLNDTNLLNGYYGLQKRYSTIYFSIDDPDVFVREMQTKLRPLPGASVSD